MSADDFRDYILGLIFYKYLSDKLNTYADQLLSEDGIVFAKIDETTAEGQEYTQSAFSLLAEHDYSSTGITLDYTPFADSTVQVYINGIALTEGYGTRTLEVYFSNDGGATAKESANLEAGDTLYWNTNIAGYIIGPNDTIDIVYEKSRRRCDWRLHCPSLSTHVQAGTGLPCTDTGHVHGSTIGFTESRGH